MTGTSGVAGALVVAADGDLLGALEAEALPVRCVALGTGTTGAGADVVGTATVTGGAVVGVAVPRVPSGSHPALAPARAAITISAAICGRRRKAGARPAMPRATGGRF
ncbi:hypothetical protein [Micromonospora sp. b486]|uniref:hypothetical protein n=1 Tax=Micromonospora sp. b486 TaxID=3053986 RepID=UPI00259C7D68|nr:hypothetical protein [Micromonospora sp. b486]MDM4781200.1 hypothetical protein [Micromonospora sp. b486]